jgi:hypothetical protein
MKTLTDPLANRNPRSFKVHTNKDTANKKRRKPLPISPKSTPTVPTVPLSAFILDAAPTDLLVEACESLNAQPLETMTMDYLAAQRPIEEIAHEYLSDTSPAAQVPALEELLCPLLVHYGPGEMEMVARSIVAAQHLPERLAPIIASELMMLDRLIFAVLTGGDPSTAADPDQVREYLPVATAAVEALRIIITERVQASKENKEHTQA